MLRSHARLLGLAWMMAAVLLGGSCPASATQVKRWLVPCEQQMCPWFEALVEPPQGWSLDKEYGEEGHVTMMTRDGHVTPKDALMYIRTDYDWEKESLDVYVTNTNDTWRKQTKRSDVKRLDDVQRDGKPAFQVYLWHNPSKPTQAYELMGFLKDVDPEHKDQSFFFQVVLTASSMAAIEAGKPGFYDVLKRM